MHGYRKPKPVMSQPTSEDKDYEEDQEDVIINIPVVYTEPVDDTHNNDHIDTNETTEIDLDNHETEIPPDRFSPSTYNYIVYSTRL